jgi:hypothetical protein
MSARSVLACLCSCLFSLLVALDPLVEAEVRGQVFPRTNTGIHLEMVFNYLEPNPGAESGVADVVWGSN